MFLLDLQAVRHIVLSALNMYSADKTGMVDYALESAGGSVISTRCSETHYSKTALLSIFGIPLWYMANSPRTVIQVRLQSDWVEITMRVLELCGDLEEGSAHIVTDVL